MARPKRQYGSGCLIETKGGFAIRWREPEIAPDGTRRRALRYETLGKISKKQATRILAEKMAVVGGKTIARSLVTFGTVSDQWLKTVLPMYKASTQKNHRHIVGKHLCPRFGNFAMSAITRQEVQAYVAHLTQAGYAPKTVDHIHDVLSAVLRTAVMWGHLEDNPAHGVRLPTLRTVRPKWALSTVQALSLLEALPPLARTMVELALLSGVRRGELFALRWRNVDEAERVIRIREAVYEGTFGTPKTEASRRTVPLSDRTMAMISAWREHVKPTNADQLLFATRSGKPISPNNVLRRWVYPACVAVGVPKCSWLVFRRTYASWAHAKNVPAKIVAQVVGHSKVDTTLNVYTQVLDGTVRTAVENVGADLFRIVQWPAGTSTLTH